MYKPSKDVGGLLV